MDAISITIVVILILVIVYFTKIYNNLVTLKHAVSKAWVNIESALKQRHDQLPKLIDLCKEYGIDQPELFNKILSARTQVMNAQQMGEVQSLSAAEQRLQNEVTSLLEIASRHNELGEDSNFQSIAGSLKDIEYALSDRCELYNDCVSTSNDRIEQFPESIVASFFSFGAYESLEIYSEDEVNLNSRD